MKTPPLLMAAAHKGTQELIALQKTVVGELTLKKPKAPPKTA